LKIHRDYIKGRGQPLSGLIFAAWTRTGTLRPMLPVW